MLHALRKICLFRYGDSDAQASLFNREALHITRNAALLGPFNGRSFKNAKVVYSSLDRDGYKQILANVYMLGENFDPPAQLD